ncbi:hypothetical protein M758_6G071800, partial [Ceratodon purpureus]
ACALVYCPVASTSRWIIGVLGSIKSTSFQAHSYPCLNLPSASIGDQGDFGFYPNQNLCLKGRTGPLCSKLVLHLFALVFQLLYIYDIVDDENSCLFIVA